MTPQISVFSNDRVRLDRVLQKPLVLDISVQGHHAVGPRHGC